LNLAEDAARLLTVRQVVSAVLRFAEAGILTVSLAQPEISALTAIGLSPEASRWLAYGSALVLGATVAVLFGELIPASFAATRPDALAMLLARPMTWLYAVLWPLSSAMMSLSNRLVAMFGGRGTTASITEEAIKTLVDAGSEEGVIEDDAKAMIYSIFQFGDTIAREIMIPRIDIVALDADTPLAEALELARTKGHSRIPVYEESIDKICGLLYAKDLLAIERTDPRRVRDLIRPAYFVPESKKAGTLLEDLQQRKIHMAIVIDEYGGTAGLVTLEDLVEEIVGDIQDEFDLETEAEYVKIHDGEYTFEAGIHLDDVNELLGESLPTDASDTLGGYVFSALGKVPLAGEIFHIHDLEIKVEAITGRRIRKVRVKRLIKPEHEPDTPTPSPDLSEVTVPVAAEPSDDAQANHTDPTESSTDVRLISTLSNASNLG
jgi:CBS domain containing-hemolysin-like protein